MFFLSDMLNKKLNLPTQDQALPGRDRPIPTAAKHFVSKRPLKGPYPEGLETAMFGLGCFWGAERLFWQTEGVWVTAVGYAGGVTPNPTYQETCTGLTGHAEVVLVVFDPEDRLLCRPAQDSSGRATIRRRACARATMSAPPTARPSTPSATPSSRRRSPRATPMTHRCGRPGASRITTEIAPAPAFYFAEADHQQYLAKNPYGYCNLKGTGVACAMPQRRRAGPTQRKPAPARQSEQRLARRHCRPRLDACFLTLSGRSKFRVNFVFRPCKTAS